MFYIYIYIYIEKRWYVTLKKMCTIEMTHNFKVLDIHLNK